MVVDNPIYETKTFEKGVPIATQSAVVIPQNTVEVVTVSKEVPVYIDRPIEAVVKSNIPVSMEIQKAVPVQVKQEINVDRIAESSVEVQCIKEKAVPMYEKQETIKEVEI